jgi:hypothetical protein
MSLLHNWTVATVLWRSGYNSAHPNFFKEDSRVGFNDGANASLVMDTMLSSTLVWRKRHSTNMCNLNDLCQLIKSYAHFCITFGTPLVRGDNCFSCRNLYLLDGTVSWLRYIRCKYEGESESKGNFEITTLVPLMENRCTCYFST